MIHSLSTEQSRQLVESCPVGLLLLDAEGRIRWINAALRDWLGGRASQIEDRNVDEVSNDLKPLFYCQSAVNLPENKDQEALYLIGNTLSLTDGGTAQYFTDVTPLKTVIDERNQLLNTINELNVTDPETGMPNQRALLSSLESQVSRSRRYQNPLSILLLRIRNLDEFQRLANTENATPLLTAVRNLLNDQLRWADVIGRYDKNHFMLILPETHLEATLQVSDLLEQRLKSLIIDDYQSLEFTIDACFAAAEWAKGDDVRLLLARANKILEADALTT
jgi:diguanylate cyclase (GGDEF)-like protein